MEADQFKHKQLLRFFRIGRKLEIAQNLSCSKRKKLLEIREVAKK